jgi:hypothetical protein
MDDTLLFLHVLSAFMLMATVVLLSSVAIGAPVGARTVTLGNRLWDIGGVGTIVFGVWIVLRDDFYDITDGWILTAIVLWFIATGAGVRARPEVSEGGEATYDALATRLHWLRAVLIVGFLVLMIWKPGV